MHKTPQENLGCIPPDKNSVMCMSVCCTVAVQALQACLLYGPVDPTGSGEVWLTRKGL